MLAGVAVVVVVVGGVVQECVCGRDVVVVVVVNITVLHNQILLSFGETTITLIISIVVDGWGDVVGGSETSTVAGYM